MSTPVSTTTYTTVSTTAASITTTVSTATATSTTNTATTTTQASDTTFLTGNPTTTHTTMTTMTPTTTLATSTTKATITEISTPQAQIAQLEETVTEAKIDKEKTEQGIAKAYAERQTLSSVSDAIYSLQNWLFCFNKGNSEYDQCKSSSATESYGPITSEYSSSKTTTDNTGILTTLDVHNTKASIETLSEIEAVTSTAANDKIEAEIIISEAEAEKKSLADFAATLSVLQGVFLTLGSGSRQDSRTLTALALATHIGTAAALPLENGVSPKHEEMANFIRDISGSTLPITCEDLEKKMQNVTALLESNIEEALALATHLRQVDNSDFTCSATQLSSLNEKVFEATVKASDLTKQKTEKISKQFANLTSAFDRVIKANDDLKNMGKLTL